MVKIKPFVLKIPADVTVALEGNTVKVKGPKGEMVEPMQQSINVEVAEGEIRIERVKDDKKTRALHGLVRALLTNAMLGVTVGYAKTLELAGVGFRAAVAGDELTLSVGFSHPVKIKAPTGITFQMVENKIKVSGIDKHLVGQIAHTIRAVKPPEPYKGKGIKYLGEKVRRKAGKAAAKAAGAK